MLKRYFKLEKNNTSVRIEAIAGLTTFLTMAYIIVVNPIILGDAGMDRNAVFLATIIAAGLGSLLMGLYANYPIGLAPTMGMNAYFAYAVVQGMGYSWQTALGAVFFSGILFLLLSVLKLRQWVIQAIPYSLKIAISVGIGLFLGLIALKNIDLITAVPNTLPKISHVAHNLPALLCFLGFALTAYLSYRGVTGAILIGMIVTTALGIALGKAHYQGIVAFPPSLSPSLLALNLTPTWSLGLASVIATFFFVSFFDATGTLIGVLHRCNLIDKTVNDPRFNKALIVDSIATLGGALVGTSTTGCYIESAAGVYAGGRTGLTAVVVGILFLAMLFFAPLVNTIPAFAAATALLYIACLMARGLKEIQWGALDESIPCLMTILATPITFSIAEGISLGYISYVLCKLARGHYHVLNVTTVVLSLFFLLYLFSLYHH